MFQHKLECMPETQTEKPVVRNRVISSCRLILYFDRQKLGATYSFSYDTIGGFGMPINAIIAQFTKVNHIFKRVEYLKLFIFCEV